MDFRAWQAEYSPELDDIKVQEAIESDREALAESLALLMWKELSASERIGYGVFKVRSSDQWAQVTAEVNRRLDAGIPADWCICGTGGVHVYEPSVCRV